MLVRAKDTGWYGDRLYYEGDEFLLQGDDKPGKWMEVVDPKAKPVGRQVVIHPTAKGTGKPAKRPTIDQAFDKPVSMADAVKPTPL